MHTIGRASYNIWGAKKAPKGAHLLGKASIPETSEFASDFCEQASGRKGDAAWIRFAEDTVHITIVGGSRGAGLIRVMRRCL